MAADVKKRIIVSLVLAGFNKFSGLMNKTSKGVNNFGQSLTMPLRQLKKMETKTGGVSTRFKAMKTSGGRLGVGMRMLTHGMKGFRMEMLGVMFFGMMLQKTLTGLLKPAMEVMGVFELWRIMLMILFMPIIKELFPYFKKLYDWFKELSPEAKKLIGWIVVFGIVLGVILFVVGAFALGIGSLILLVGLLAIPIVATVVLIAIIVLAIIALVVIIVIYWERINAFFQEILDAIKAVFKAAFDWIDDLTGGWLGRMRDAIVEKWNAVKDFFSGLWEDIKQIFKDAWDWIKTNVIDKITNAINDLREKTGIGTEFGSGPLGKALGMGSENDFVWRPGQAPVSINPQDTLVGFKGSPPGMGGGGITVAPVYNIMVSGQEEIERMLEENNRNLVDDLRRMARL